MSVNPRSSKTSTSCASSTNSTVWVTASTGPDPAASTGPDPAAPTGPGPDPVASTGPDPAAPTGPDPAASPTDPCPAASPTGPDSEASPAGPDPEASPAGPSPAAPAGPDPVASIDPDTGSASASSKDDSLETLSPLHLAVRDDNVSLIRELLDKTPEERETMLRQQDSKGRTALHLSAMSGSLPVVSLLLDSGADWKAIDKDDATPLHLACAEGDVRLVDLLLRHEALNPSGCTSAYLEQRDCVGSTALHLACFINRIEVVELLLDSGADLWAVDSNRMTPLHLASQLEDADLAAVLIRRAQGRPDYADYLEQRNEYGWTALHVACKFGKYNPCQVLLHSGADRSAVDHDSKTPLDYLLASKTIVSQQMRRLFDELSSE